MGTHFSFPGRVLIVEGAELEPSVVDGPSSGFGQCTESRGAFD